MSGGRGSVIVLFPVGVSHGREVMHLLLEASKGCDHLTPHQHLMQHAAGRDRQLTNGQVFSLFGRRGRNIFW